MTTSRKLEDIASSLEDMSTTIEEIKDKVETEPIATDTLDSLQIEMTRAAALIEESLETSHPAAESEAPDGPTRNS